MRVCANCDTPWIGGRRQCLCAFQEMAIYKEVGMLDKVNSKTRRNRVYQVLRDGGWHKTAALSNADTGGSEGMRRLRELRQECEAGLRPGWKTVTKRRVGGDSTQYEYRLVSDGEQRSGATVVPAPLTKRKKVARRAR